MYAVEFTRFEKHSWFSLRPAERATHDNLICFCKDWRCVCISRLQCVIYCEKVLSFHLILTLHQGRSQTFWFGGATGGASFATVNGLCGTFRKRPTPPDVTWKILWGPLGGQAKFWGVSGPPSTPLAPPLHFTFINIGLVVWNKKKSNCIKPSALTCVLFKYGRAFSSPVHVRCDRSNELRKKRVCCKIYPACEANDDTYTA